MDRSLPVRRLGMICLFWDRLDSAVDSGIVTRFGAVMVSPFATRTVGPFFYCFNVVAVLFGGWINIMG